MVPSEKIGWQFDPLYTRMVPAHYLIEIDQIGCPDPAPRYQRFFEPPFGEGPSDMEAAGAAYVGAAWPPVSAGWEWSRTASRLGWPSPAAWTALRSAAGPARAGGIGA